MISERVAVLPLIKFGNIKFEKVSTKIGVQNQPRIGNGFFKHCIVNIDNFESYKIKKSNEY